MFKNANFFYVYNFINLFIMIKFIRNYKEDFWKKKVILMEVCLVI